MADLTITQIAQGVTLGIKEAGTLGYGGMASGGSGSSSGSSGSSGGSGSSGNRQSSDERSREIKLQKAMQDQTSSAIALNRALSDSSKILKEFKDTAELNNKMLERSIYDIESIDEVERLPARFRKAMSSSGSEFAKAVSSNVESLDDLFEATDKLSQFEAVRDLMEQFKDGKNSMGQTIRDIEKLGFSAEETDKFLERLTPLLGTNSDSIASNSQAFEEATEVIEDFDKELTQSQQDLKKFNMSIANIDVKGLLKTSFFDKLDEISSGGVGRARKSGKVMEGLGIKNVRLAFAAGLAIEGLTSLASAVWDGFAAASKLGTNMELVDAALSGMSPAEYAELQKANRTAINAMSGGFDEFGDLLKSTSSEMIGYTFSLAEATKLTASFVSTGVLIGGAGDQVLGFVKQQKDMFASFHDSLSITADEFQKLTSQMSQDGELRKTMYKMGKKERTQALMDMQVRYQRFRQMGMLEEQAISLAKHFEGLSGGKSAKDRMKEAYKMRAVMGGMGLAKDGARFQTLHMKGSARMSPKEKEEYDKIVTKMQGATSKKMQGSFQSEMWMQEILKKAGLEGLAGENAPTMALALVVADDQKVATSQVIKTGKTMDDMLGIAKDTFDLLKTEFSSAWDKMWGNDAQTNLGKNITSQNNVALGYQGQYENKRRNQLSDVLNEIEKAKADELTKMGSSGKATPDDMLAIVSKYSKISESMTKSFDTQIADFANKSDMDKSKLIKEEFGDEHGAKMLGALELSNELTKQQIRQYGETETQKLERMAEDTKLKEQEMLDIKFGKPGAGRSQKN